MRRSVLFICVLAFLAMPFAKAVSASLDPANLSFEGNFQFDKNGSYCIYGVSYPLNVLGVLTVFDDNDPNNPLGNLTLQGQKNYDEGKWDETYFGHWAFHSTDDPCDVYEMDLFPDLLPFHQQQGGEEMLEFTLLGFSDALGTSDDIPKIVGSIDGNDFTGSSVPIPSTLLLIATGIVGILGFKRRVA
jgi:hypothetical protein